MQNVRVALGQMNSTACIKENLDTIKRIVREAKEHGAHLVVLPERCEYLGAEISEHAWNVPGEITDFFSQLAREEQLWLHCGSITCREGEKTSNLSLFFDPQGMQTASYKKIHLFDVDLENGLSQKESEFTLAGDQITLTDTDFGKVGLSICYDIRFPQLFAKMADLGAEILIVCADFTDQTGQAHWKPLLQARAIENTCYVIACGQCGDGYAFQAHGHSMVIDPWGRVLAEAGSLPEILYADLNADLLTSIRRQIPCLPNRRPELY